MPKLTPKPCPGDCGDVRPRRVGELCLRCRRDLLEGREERARREREAGGVFEIEGEKAYPVWSIQAWWLQDREEGSDYIPRMLEDAPEGRFWNSTCYDRMFQEELTPGAVARKVAESGREMLSAEKYAAAHASDFVAVVRFVRREVWCLQWFNHFTYDVGQTDAQVLDSFRRYVERMQALNSRESEVMDGLERPAVVLMGAEDRWRWYGGGGRDEDERTPPPCRCEHCKEQGVIRINH